MKSRISIAFLSINMSFYGSEVLRADPPSGIYWAHSVNSEFPQGGEIWRAELDGSNPQRIVDGLGFPRPITVDASEHKIYWGDGYPGDIARCNLDGTGVELVVFNTSAAAGSLLIDEPAGLAIDESNRILYWTDFVNDIVARTNLNTLQTVTLVDMPLNPDFIPYGMDLDLAQGHMYWVDSLHGTIRRANLNGAGLLDVVAGINSPFDLELDLEGGKVYWIQYTNGIWRADLSGANVQQVVTFPGGLFLELDRLHRKLYRFDPYDGLVRSNLDGLNEEIVIPLAQLPHYMGGIAVFHDCNNNRIDDYDELTTNDCNHNRQPDDCESECGTNGIPDECETPEACCQAGAQCAFLPPDCCLQAGRVPAGPGTSCSGGPGPDEICGRAWACCTPGVVGTDGTHFCDNWTLHFCVTQIGGIPLGPTYVCETMSSDDNDDVVDLCDNCPQIANPEQNDCNDDGVGDVCEPNSANGDSDADGVCNGGDGCPDDPNKIEPGVCGCGQPDVDSDGDSVLDCDDQCPGQPDADSDHDGVLDCDDRCPGAADVDSDGDGVLNCIDQCPGEADVDSDFDSVLDCLDVCSGDNDLLDDNDNGLPDCLEPGRIPTVSQWGLLILTLLLLIAAKTKFSPPRSASVLP